MSSPGLWGYQEYKWVQTNTQVKHLHTHTHKAKTNKKIWRLVMSSPFHFLISPVLETEQVSLCFHNIYFYVFICVFFWYVVAVILTVGQLSWTHWSKWVLLALALSYVTLEFYFWLLLAGKGTAKVIPSSQLLYQYLNHSPCYPILPVLWVPPASIIAFCSRVGTTLCFETISHL